jgi:cytochrome c5
MRVSIAALCAVALACTAAAPASAQNVLPPGPGRDLVGTACTQCHNLSVIMSMRNGAEGWKAYVHNMIMRGAQLTPREADTVIAYLASAYGPDAAASAKGVQVALPSGDGKDLVEARCTVCHDLERVTAARRHRQDWPGLVANMVGRGAPVSPDEAQTITAYLAAHFSE